MSAQFEHSTDHKKSNWIVVAMGCGCLLLLLLCSGVTAFLVYTYPPVGSTKEASLEAQPATVKAQDGVEKSVALIQQPADFFRFLGVEAGATLANFTKLHGDPIRVEDKEK